jgi:PAS domain S-box-containing protein
MKTNAPLPGIELLFDLSPDLICLSGADGYFIRANKVLCEVLGYDEEHLLSNHMLTFVHPDDKEDTQKQLAALSGNKTSCLFKNRYCCANGSYKWLSWSVVRLPDGSLYGTARDVTPYKDVQDQLEKVAGQNQKIFDHSLDVLCQLDAAGRFLRVSKAVEAILGYQESEMVGRHALEFIHPSDRNETVSVYKEVRTGSNQANVENRYRHKNGTYVPMVWSASWLEKEQFIFAVGRDATEREKQKAQIRLKEQRLTALIESGNDIVLILSPEGVYQFVSPSVKTILHTEPEFYLGKVTFQFIHPDDLDWVGAAFKAVLDTREPVYIAPFRLQVVSGDWVWVETIATNRLNDPAIEGIVINAKDVSAKRKQEQEKQRIARQLESSNERFNLALKATKDVIWDWRLETNELNRNLSFQKLFGYESLHGTTETKHESWENHLFPDDKAYVLKSIKEALLNPEVMYWSKEYRYLKADQAIAIIYDQGYIIRNEKGEAVRMVGAMHDITESKAKEQRILKQNEQLREIAQINSHELRKPVATILGLMDIFDQSSVLDQENREILTLLEGTVRELDVVIRRINDKASDGV